jgi:hypothetical protein
MSTTPVTNDLVNEAVLAATKLASGQTVSTANSSMEVTVPNTSGTVTFQLIVTDNLGTKSVAATATVEIQGAPTAHLTATPAVVAAGGIITLDGAKSVAVAPGTIASYAFTLEPAVG